MDKWTVQNIKDIQVIMIKEKQRQAELPHIWEPVNILTWQMTWIKYISAPNLSLMEITDMQMVVVLRYQHIL